MIHFPELFGNISRLFVDSLWLIVACVEGCRRSGGSSSGSRHGGGNLAAGPSAMDCDLPGMGMGRNLGHQIQVPLALGHQITSSSTTSTTSAPAQSHQHQVPRHVVSYPHHHPPPHPRGITYAHGHPHVVDDANCSSWPAGDETLNLVVMPVEAPSDQPPAPTSGDFLTSPPASAMEWTQTSASASSTADWNKDHGDKSVMSICSHRNSRVVSQWPG
jgi:hypothetical protein